MHDGCGDYAGLLLSITVMALASLVPKSGEVNMISICLAPTKKVRFRFFWTLMLGLFKKEYNQQATIDLVVSYLQ